MSKSVEKNRSSAYLIVITVSIIAWLAPTIHLLYLWIFISARYGVFSTNFLLANIVGMASMILLPVVTAGLVYRALHGAALARLAYGCIAAFGTTLVGYIAQSLMAILSRSTGTALFPIFNGIGDLLVPQLIVAAVVLGATFWILRKIKYLSDNSKKEQWLRRFSALAAVSYFVLTTLNTLVIMAEQYPRNPNMSAFVSILIGSGMALGVFLVFWILERFRKSSEPVVIAALATLLCTALLSVVTSLGNIFEISVLGLPSLPAAAVATVAILAVGFMFWLIYRAVRRMI